ncbi:MAG TPA: hypothetical protein VGA35_05620 [bacterium]
MRRVLGTLCVVLLGAGSIGRAAADAPLRAVEDAKGLFTISVPPDWMVGSSPFSEGFLGGLRKGRLSDSVLSAMAVNGPDNTGGTPFLALAALDLPAPISPEAFGRRAAPKLPTGFTLTQEGQAKIAGREAYFMYFAADFGSGSPSFYGVLAFFTVGKTGFAVGGATINDPEHIQKDFTAISKILESFRPSPKLGGPSRPLKAAVSGD